MEFGVIENEGVDRSAAKRVALRLQGLSLSDRSWLLERLEPVQRRAVESAESELRSILGTQRLDFSFFLDAEGEPEQGPGRQSHRQLINSLELEQLRSVLDRLPKPWVKVLLDSGTWERGEQYKERLSTKQRQQLENCQVPTVPPRVNQALADAVAELSSE